MCSLRRSTHRSSVECRPWQLLHGSSPLCSAVFSAVCCLSTPWSSLAFGGLFFCTRCGYFSTRTLPNVVAEGKIFQDHRSSFFEFRSFYRIEWVREWAWWRLFRAYFPLYLERTEELPQDKNYLFACYPHGVLCTGLFGNFATKSPEYDKLFPGLATTVHTLDGNFSHPFIRDLILSLGKLLHL